MEIKQRKISELKPAEYNPRQLSEKQFKDLQQSFKNLDVLEPAVINMNPDRLNVIISGHQRLKVAESLGMAEFPCVEVDFSPEKEKEANIRMNKNTGEWNFDLLANNFELDDLKNWGFEDFDLGLDAGKDGLTEDDAVPEAPEEPKTKKGDLYILGNHRLLCGDATKKEDVEKLMNGQKAELLFTSPPYTDMREYNGNKDLSIDYLINFISTFYPFVEYQVINLGIKRENNEVVEYWQEYIKKAKDCGYKFISWNIWDRLEAGSIGNQTALFEIDHEWLFIFGKEIKKLNRTIKHSEVTANFINMEQVPGV